MTINEKIAKIREVFCNGDNTRFAEMLSQKTQYASNICKNGKSVGPELKEKLLELFPQVSRSWLLADEGEMLKSDLQSTTFQQKDFRLVPLYNLDAVGGMHSLNDLVDAKVYIERYVPFLDAREGDICFPVSGNSMIPTYSPGSIIMVRKVESWNEYFGYGNSFVLFLKDGRRVLKQVQKSEENSKENILCVSFNNNYPPEELPRKLIVEVYKVVKSMNNEGF